MSTQSARSIRFTHSSPQQAFRLMELSPELLELITSKDAPTLYLKSGRTDHLSASTGPENAVLVNLCTPTQTFRIRQVQSSNSIHIIQPSNGHNNNKIIPLRNPATHHEETAENGTEITLSPETVTAVAKCGSTLELQVIDDVESFALAKAMLARMLRVWDDHDATLYKQSDQEGDVAMADESEITLLERRKNVKKSIIADLPFAESKCLRAWTELCAFSPGGGYHADGMVAIAFRPSASSKLNVWKKILECCTLQDIDLENQFLVLDLWKAVSGDEVDGDMAMPKALFDAVIWRIVEQSGEVSLDSDDVNLRWANVDKDFCTKWIGETYLEAIAPTERAAIGKSEFINSWKDLLPETWRDHAILSNLPTGSYKTPDPVSIHFVLESDREKSKQEASGSAAGSKAKNSRDWHERFKSQRK